MEESSVLLMGLFLLPVFAWTICTGYMLRFFFSKKLYGRKSVKLIILVYCILGLMTSIGFFFFYFLPDLFGSWHPYFAFSVLFPPVIQYFLFLFFTHHEKFSSHHAYHLILPFSLSIFYAFTPFLQQFVEVGTWNIQKTVSALVFLFCMSYAVYGAYLLYCQYKKKDKGKKMDKVVNHRIFLWMGLVASNALLFLILPFFLGNHLTAILAAIIAPVIVVKVAFTFLLGYALAKYIILPIRFEKFLQPKIVAEDVVFLQGKRKQSHANRVRRRNLSVERIIALEKMQFEAYFKKEKPFLNPKLKIDDLAIPLNTNRTYISHFINQVYGQNFNQYVNFCRLEELDRIALLPQNTSKKVSELIHQVGFSNYQTYQRAQRQKNNKTKAE